MPVPFYYTVAEAHRRLINPLSAAKILKLGRVCNLGPRSAVFDLGCGKGEPATLLAAEFGCRVDGVDHEPTFLAAARLRATERGVADRCTFVEADGAEYTIDPGAYDLALALGTSFIFGGCEPTLAALAPALGPGGFVALGEPYWRAAPPAEYLAREGFGADDFATLDGTRRRLARCDFALVHLQCASRDEWDSYEADHWRAVEEWHRAHPDHPQAAEVMARVERERESYLRWGRAALGFGVFVGRRMQEPPQR